LSAVGIYPTTLALDALFAAARERLPQWVATLLTVCVPSELVTWAIMPALTQLLGRCRYADLGTSDPG
jgi:antibiotic biosynthesis monooxygenase (ABM) superfamily enzyme